MILGVQLRLRVTPPSLCIEPPPCFGQRGLVLDGPEPQGGDRPAHILQLWVNLPREKKLVLARFQELRAADLPSRTADGVSTRVFSGELTVLPPPPSTMRR